MHWYNYLFTIGLSAFSGWMITWAATKILFYPRKPLRILGFTLQGLFPKNLLQLTGKLGMVSSELLPFSDIEEKITDSRNLNKLKPEIERHVDEFLNKKLKDVFPILSKFIGVKTTNQLKDAFMQELGTMFPEMMKKYMTLLKEDIDLEKFVAEKITSLPAEKVESIIKRITRKDFRLFVMFGTVFGLFIGILQVIIEMLIK